MTNPTASSSGTDYSSVSVLAQAAETRRRKFRKLGFIFGIIAASSPFVLTALLSLQSVISQAAPALVSVVGGLALILMMSAFPSIVVGFVFMALAISARNERDRLVAASADPGA